ncbi:MAG: hypothetical protein ACE5KM_07200, partial [Planctomycetaceae bacterium]
QACGSLFFLSAAVALSVTAFSGCGGGGGAEKSGTADETKSRLKKSGGGGNPLLAQNGGTHRGVWVKDGQKYYNNHPYDVWYPNAYEVAADQRPVGANGNGGKTNPTRNGKKEPPANKTPMPNSSGDWESIASIAVLEAEVKRIRNVVSQKTKTFGSYRDNYKRIAYNGATLAAVAHVISLHPGKVTWKADALYVRDVGMKINEKATGRAKKDFDATKAAVEQLVDLLNRNKPADLKPPEKKTEFFEFAERAGMMKRMEEAFLWLSKDVNSEAKFKSESETIVHEATILGLLVKCAGDLSYDRADEAGYQKHVAATLKATQQIQAAVKGRSFADFGTGINVIQNNCTECHRNFKND